MLGQTQTDPNSSSPLLRQTGWTGSMWCLAVVENFATTLDKITYVQTFKALRMRYDQHQDRMMDRSSLEPVNSLLRAGAPGPQAGRFRRDDRQLDEDEELWFNDEEDFDEEGSGPVLGPGGLGEPTKASCTSVSTTSPQATAAAAATLPCQEKLETPSIVKVMEEDKKKEVLGNGLASESEPTAVVKPASSENGSAVKKLGALVDYNDSDSDEENGSSDEDNLPPSKRLKTASATEEAAEVSH